MIACTIGGVTVSVGNASFSLQDPLEDRAVLMFTVLDSAGTATYTRGDPVTFADPGIINYTGYVQSDQPTKDGLALPYVEHVITCMDGVYNLGKRTNNQNYLNWQAGNIAIDFVRSTLADEGITIAAAMHRDTTVSDFNEGNLNGLAGAINGTDDGDLELAIAGSALSITEATTTDFSSGTLTNVTASANTLFPSTVSAISMQTLLPISIGVNYLYMEIWSGSMTVGTLDTLNYDIWISSTSPAFNAGIDLNFSDLTSLNTYVGPLDQNFLAPSPVTDLSSYAKDTWYTRSIALGSALNGKTINSVCIAVAGAAAGTYNVFFKNVYLGSQSGSPFFSTSATTTQVNPPTVFSSAGYISTLTFISVVQAITGATSARVSPAHSIDAVKLIGTTFISWNANMPSSSLFQMAVSYDGNTFLLCTNNQPLPGLPAGSNVAGISLYLQEIFSSGTAPTALPVLADVTVTLTPAPNATKSDISTNYGTSAQWNAGTLLGVAPNSNGALTLVPFTRNWNDNLITNQTYFPSLSGSPVQAASGGNYNITVPISTGNPYYGLSRFDFAGAQTDFVIEWDQVLTVASATHGQVGVVYRTTGWSAYDLNFAYLVEISLTFIHLGYGSNNNSATSTGTFTALQTVTQTFVSGTSYHFKLVVSGQSHQVYLNGAASPVISVTDATYVAPGNIGFRVLGNPVSFTGTTVGSIDNFNLATSTLGTWQSASNSLAALSTISGSVISWLETLASGGPSATAIVQTSIDGGTTWKRCTNNALIPGLINGTNVSALLLLVRVTLFSQTVVGSPVIGGLNWRILGAFPSTSGTRDTAPMGNDTSITRTVGSGWGTAFDGQTWAQTGTGTTAVATGEATITNTTGTVYMRLGTRTGTDLDGTHRFSLSSSGMTEGIFLRFVDTNNYYALAATTSGVFILKRLAGVTTTLATVSMALSINTDYRMRFRVAGSNAVALSGNVWIDGTREPTVNTAGQWDDSLWLLTAFD